MEAKFKMDYDSREDVLYLYSEKGKVKESIELSKDIVIDLDKNDNLVAIEIFNAHKFLHTLNEEITKNMLSELKETKLKLVKYSDYLIITLIFNYKGKTIIEKLPALSTEQYESPLIASIA